MSNIGLPVPPGFTITTEMCALYYERNKILPSIVWKDIHDALKQLEIDSGRILGDKNCPLLVSVRSGAAISMPGMMDTVLNLGINDDTVQGLSKLFGERFAWVSLYIYILYHTYKVYIYIYNII
jgi:pyruvate,orthophosphate dikinase